MTTPAKRKPSAGPSDFGTSKHAEACGCIRCRGFSEGNQVARKHGARSELALAPVRQEMDMELARDYPTLDDRRRALLADRLARIALARTWVDDRGVVRDDEGRIFDIADRIEKWSNRAEQILAELELEARAALKADPVARIIAASKQVRDGE